MQSIKKDAIGGFNSFIDQQKPVPGKAILSLILFNCEYVILYSGKDIKDVEYLNESSYVPNGSTALVDAIGKTLNDRSSTEGKPGSPDKYLVVILTDGEENASREYTSLAISKMIEDLRNKGNWEFIFLAANQDAFSVARGMNISVDNSMNFTADSVSVNTTFRKMSKGSQMYRSSSLSDNTVSVMKSASLEVDKEMEEEAKNSK